MGDAAGYATVGILAKYRDEFEYWIAHRRSRYDGGEPRGAEPSMPEIFIDGEPVEAEDGQTVMQAALRERPSTIPYFCWHPELSVPGNCRICMVEVEATARAAGSTSPATCRSPRACSVLTDSPTRARTPQGDAAAHHAQPPGRLRHLRQGRRVHAAGLPLRVQRRAVGLARRQGARDQAPRALRAHRARQRALHPVLALRALHARDLEVERRSASRTAATTRWCARSRTAPSSATRTPTT